MVGRRRAKSTPASTFTPACPYSNKCDSRQARLPTKDQNGTTSGPLIKKRIAPGPSPSPEQGCTAPGTLSASRPALPTPTLRRQPYRPQTARFTSSSAAPLMAKSRSLAVRWSIATTSVGEPGAGEALNWKNGEGTTPLRPASPSPCRRRGRRAASCSPWPSTGSGRTTPPPGPPREPSAPWRYRCGAPVAPPPTP